MVKVAAVFGLSGVGKSWLIARYAASHSVSHVQASKLLRDAKADISGAAVTAEQLRTGSVLNNQQLLITSFVDLRARAIQPIIFDGHCVVDNGQQLVEIPAEVVLSLGVSGVIFVQGSPQKIVGNRINDQTRVRPLRSFEEISLHQIRAHELCIDYANRIGVDLHIVDAGDDKAMGNAIEAILGISKSV